VSRSEKAKWSGAKKESLLLKPVVYDLRDIAKKTGLEFKSS
jgi:hypothetical protein